MILSTWAGIWMQGSETLLERWKPNLIFGLSWKRIDVGQSAGQAYTVWSRRIKVPLARITWELIEKVQAVSKIILETRFRGTGKDGGPTSGSVRAVRWEQLTRVGRLK